MRAGSPKTRSLRLYPAARRAKPMVSTLASRRTPVRWATAASISCLSASCVARRPVAEPRAGHRHVERLAADLAQLRLHEVARSAEPEKVADGVHLVAGGDRGVGGEHD